MECVCTNLGIMTRVMTQVNRSLMHYIYSVAHALCVRCVHECVACIQLVRMNSMATFGAAD